MDSLLILSILIVIIIVIFAFVSIKNNKETLDTAFDIKKTVVCTAVSPWECGGSERVSTLNNKYITEFMNVSPGFKFESLISFKQSFGIYCNNTSFRVMPQLILYADVNYVNPVVSLHLFRDDKGTQLNHKNFYYEYVSYAKTRSGYIPPFKSLKWLVNTVNAPILNCFTKKYINFKLKAILYPNMQATGRAIKTNQDIPDLSLYKFQAALFLLIILYHYLIFYVYLILYVFYICFR